MANEKNTEKKENPLLGGILMLVAGLVLVLMGSDYNWVLFGTIEIPLQIPGGIFAVIGLVQLLSGIKAKNKEKEDKTEE